jgi:diacylglycerol kinase family enzyme
VERLAELLREAGLVVRVLTEIDQFAEEAETLHRAGQLRAVVAAGGDGTVGLIAHRTSPGVAIAILPLGTENLLARQLGISSDAAAVCNAILRGKTRRLDAGQVQGRLFLLMVGCGFDAEVVRRLHGSRSGHIHHLSYVKPILQSIRNYDYPDLRVYCESPAATSDGEGGSRAGCEGPVCLTAKWVFAVNLPRYAMGLRIAPEAQGDDGLLDVGTFERGSLWQGLRYLAGITLGWHVGWPDFALNRVRRVRVESDEPVPYQLDGDPGGYLPVEIEVLPRRLTVVVP